MLTLFSIKNKILRYTERIKYTIGRDVSEYFVYEKCYLFVYNE